MSEQPTPYAGQRSVTRALMDLLAERERKGIETYGRSLETFNGRDAPRDLVEEMLDGAQYALQWQMERTELLRRIDDLEQRLADAETARNLAHRLAKRAKGERDAAREALRAVEWLEPADDFHVASEKYCPLCIAEQGTPHAEDCLIGKALTPAPLPTNDKEQGAVCAE